MNAKCQCAQHHYENRMSEKRSLAPLPLWEARPFWIDSEPLNSGQRFFCLAYPARAMAPGLASNCRGGKFRIPLTLVRSNAAVARSFAIRRLPQPSTTRCDSSPTRRASWNAAASWHARSVRGPRTTSTYGRFSIPTSYAPLSPNCLRGVCQSRGVISRRVLRPQQGIFGRTVFGFSAECQR
jgi:hypothetical protein